MNQDLSILNLVLHATVVVQVSVVKLNTEQYAGRSVFRNISKAVCAGGFTIKPRPTTPLYGAGAA